MPLPTTPVSIIYHVTSSTLSLVLARGCTYLHGSPMRTSTVKSPVQCWRHHYDRCASAYSVIQCTLVKQLKCCIDGGKHKSLH